MSRTSPHAPAWRRVLVAFAVVATGTVWPCRVALYATPGVWQDVYIDGFARRRMAWRDPGPAAGRPACDGHHGEQAAHRRAAGRPNVRAHRSRRQAVRQGHLPRRGGRGCCAPSRSRADVCYVCRGAPAASASHARHYRGSAGGVTPLGWRSVNSMSSAPAINIEHFVRSALFPGACVALCRWSVAAAEPRFPWPTWLPRQLGQFLSASGTCPFAEGRSSIVSTRAVG